MPSPRFGVCSGGVMFALVDCNNFYASCERVFQPALCNRPIVVLSNGDGCIVARSNEAKALGIPNGVPSFQWRNVFQEKGVSVFSSNYALYGDLSNRVMQVLAGFGQELEVYSVDEAFLQLREETDLVQLGYDVRRQVLQCLGIPVSVGIARTKALAKIANYHAKRSENGLEMMSIPAEDDFLQNTPIGEVWGIGRRYARFLSAHGIETAYQFKQTDDVWIRKHLTVVGLRLLHELRGTSYWALQETIPAKKGIASTRSFQIPVAELQDLREAIATFMSRAAEKLRKQNAVCQSVLVFISTKHYGNGPHYTNSFSTTLPEATAYTPSLIRSAWAALEKIFRHGFAYKKAGVMLSGIHPNTERQSDLFEQRSHHAEDHIMSVLDAINQKYGSGTLRIAATGPKKAYWHMHQLARSPRFTTRWEDLIVVHTK